MYRSLKFETFQRDRPASFEANVAWHTQFDGLKRIFHRLSPPCSSCIISQ